MSYIEMIKRRRSVRNYTGEPLSAEHKEKILKYIAGLKHPFENEYLRIELISTDMGAGEEPVQLGTYGVISGARDFLVLIYEDGDMGQENAGYVFEQLILYCTELGLGTCWLGGTFKKSDFAKQVDLQPTEILRIVSPVGYIKEKKRLIDYLVGYDLKHRRGKSFKKLFFDGYFDKSLTPENAGIFLEPFEMARLGPSANNMQSWRVVLNSGIVHFYYHMNRAKFYKIDTGIAMCHFELACKELNINGHFAVWYNVRKTSLSIDRYSATWLKDGVLISLGKQNKVD